MAKKLTDKTKMKGEVRSLLIPVGDVKLDKAARTLEFSFSSELPVDMWFGVEILSHAQGAVRMDRLNAGAPLLFNHDMGKLGGIVEKAWIDPVQRKGRCVVRFANNDLGNELLGLVDEDILRNVSVGYRVYEFEAQGEGDPAWNPEIETYIATDWEPLEISLCTVPADPSVGVGRNSALETEREVTIKHKRALAPETTTTTETRSNTMTPEEIAAAAEAARLATATRTAAPAVVAPVDNTAALAAATSSERERVMEISAMCDTHKMPELGSRLIKDGASISEARAAVLKEIGKGPASGERTEQANLPLTDREQRSYSLVRALRAKASGDWKDAGFERECSNEISKRIGKETGGFFMPMNTRLSHEAERVGIEMQRRDASGAAYATSTNTQGGYLVATQLLASQFIEVLRNKARVMQLGAKMLSGLVGNVDIPRQTSQTPAYWVGEGADVTEGEAAFDKITLTPKTIGALSQVTRQMLQQSTPDIEILVRDDLAKVLALGIDLAALKGTGSSGQPRGILTTRGIGSVVGGTNGAALTIDHLIDLETAVTAANVDENNLAYIANAQSVGTLKKLKSTTGQYLWNNAPGLMGMRGPTPGEINGYPVARSNQMPSNGSKGTNTTLSSLIFGNWGELIIGEWGVLEILPNPYGTGYASGTLEIRALQTVDIQVRHAAAFSAMTDAQATAGHVYS